MHVGLQDPLIRRIVQTAFPTYRGRTVQIRVDPGPHDCRSYWDGGSRDYYVLVRLADMATLPIPQQSAFDQPMPGLDRVVLQPGIVLVEHTFFQGADLGVTIHVHPDNAPLSLPEPVGEPPTEHEQIVLRYTEAYLPAYRFPEAHRRTGITRAEWDAAKARCIARGWLNRRGAITAAGRNLLERLGVDVTRC